MLEYRPLPAVTVVLARRAQYSPSQLLGYEQFSIGNYTVGRGLDPGTVQGDSGAGTSLELRYGMRKFLRSGAIGLTPYAFFDAAWAWRNDDGLIGDPGRARVAYQKALGLEADNAAELRRKLAELRSGS